MSVMAADERYVWCTESMKYETSDKFDRHYIIRAAMLAKCDAAKYMIELT